MNLLVKDYFFLFIGFLFTFFVPGFLLIESFFENIPRIFKLPLYLLLSVLTSTYVVYLVSLLVGFTKSSILISFFLFIPWLIYYFGKKNFSFYFFRKHRAALAFSAFSFLVFLIALYPGIFTNYKGYFVMSAVNWQDTAMHQGIIQSLTQGNFPPQAPYFAGAPLSYYYFSDFHTAILATLVEGFFPRILVFDNPFFAAIFSLSLYSLSFYITKSRLTSLLSSFLGVFSGNFMFLRFFKDVSDLGTTSSTAIIELVKNHGYTLEDKLMRMVPMTDYFLQNRPMMVGLPAVVLVFALILAGYREKEKKCFLLAGIIASLLIKFQFFAFGVSVLLFVLGTLIFLKRKSFKKAIIYSILFLIPVSFSAVIILITKVDGDSLIEIFKESFSLGPWDTAKSFSWYLKFSLFNFGVPFAGALVFFLGIVIGRIKFSKSYLFLATWAALMYLVPHLVKFTIYDGDMFKFFYFMMIPISIAASIPLARLYKKKIGIFLLIPLLVITSLTSLLTLSWSFTNKNFAYSKEDYEAGLWIRENTPERSFFVTLPTVHSAVSEIGGRLRLLSYINWPYSHGFNKGKDNVFTRLGDIEDFYQSAQEGRDKTESILRRYNIKYVYFSPEERGKYPFAEKTLDSSSYLRAVYNQGGVVIYEVVRL